LAQVYICTNIRATTQASGLARTMSRSADSAPLYSEPKTADDVLSHIIELARSDDRILQQELSPRLEAPQGDQSEEALEKFIWKVDYMCALVGVFKLHLNRLSQKAGEKRDKFSLTEVACASYFEVKQTQEAEYKKRLPDAKARLERFLKQQPAPAAEDAQAAGSSHDMLEPPSKRLCMD
jgi:hypothetical protein